MSFRDGSQSEPRNLIPYPLFKLQFNWKVNWGFVEAEHGNASFFNSLFLMCFKAMNVHQGQKKLQFQGTIAVAELLEYWRYWNVVNVQQTP